MTDLETGRRRPAGPPLHRTVGRAPRDLVWIVLSAAVAAGVVVAASAARVGTFERDLLFLFNHLPDWLGLVLQPTVLLGSAFAVAVVTGLALFAKWVRLGIGLAVAGTLGWLAVRFVGSFVSRPAPPDVVAQLVLRGAAADGPGPFPSAHLAIVVALVVVTRPWVGERLRRLLPWVAVAVAVAALYVGLALPLGVAAGAMVGWWAGSATNVLVGAPGRRVGPGLVHDVLRDAGIEAERIAHVHGRTWAAAEYAVETRSGDRVAVRVIRASVRRLGRLDRLRRFLASVDAVDESALGGPRHQVEHEALVSLLADRAGVRVPPVRVARELPGGAALIATARITGRPLGDLPADEIGDDLLDRIWSQVAALRQARVAHHALWPDAVLVDDDGLPWITHLARARAAATDEQMLEDVAELLAGLAAHVGTDRAVEAAFRVLGVPTVLDAMRYLQPLSMPRHVRLALGNHPEVLADVRTHVADRTGTPSPDTSLRLNPTTVLGLLVAGGAIYVLLPQIGSFEDLVSALRGASWGWLAAALAFGLLTAPAAAIAYWGSAFRPLPLLTGSAVQLATTFTGRLTPGGIGGIGLNLLFMEKVGLTRKEAATAATLNAAGGVVVHAALFGLAVLVIGADSIQHGLHVPTGWPVLAAVIVVLVGAGVVLGSPFGRRRFVAPVLDMGRTLLGTVRHPLRATALLGGSAGVTLANALAFLASAYAFGIEGPSAAKIMAVYIAGAAIGAAAPTPGGLGAVEAALVAALSGIGVASSSAVAVVLSFRLLTFWVPILPGMAAYRLLQHHDRI